MSRANERRGRGGFCQIKSTSTGTGYLAGTELSSQLRNPVGSFALQEWCFYCVKLAKKRFSFTLYLSSSETQGQMCDDNSASFCRLSPVKSSTHPYHLPLEQTILVYHRVVGGVVVM